MSGPKCTAVITGRAKTLPMCAMPKEGTEGSRLHMDRADRAGPGTACGGADGNASNCTKLRMGGGSPTRALPRAEHGRPGRARPKVNEALPR